MKAGDKIYFFNSSRHEIDEGELLWTSTSNGKTYAHFEVSSQNGAKIWHGGFRLGWDCFASREELCEHYRKIFGEG